MPEASNSNSHGYIHGQSEQTIYNNVFVKKWCRRHQIPIAMVTSMVRVYRWLPTPEALKNIHAVPYLPSREILKQWSFPAYHDMACFFNVLYEISRTYCRMNMCYNMNMVTCSTDNIWVTGFIFQDSCYISKKNMLVHNWKKWYMIFAGKDKLV